MLVSFSGSTSGLEIGDEAAQRYTAACLEIGGYVGVRVQLWEEEAATA